MLFVVVMALDIVSSKYDLERDCCPCGVLLLCYKIFIPTEFLSPLIQLSATRDKHADDEAQYHIKHWDIYILKTLIDFTLMSTSL